MTDDRSGLAGRLAEDHREFDRAWDAIVALPLREAPRRLELFVAFRDGLLRHIAAEEELMFPVLDAAGPRERALATRLREEHATVREVLARIEAAVRASAPSLESLGDELNTALWDHNAREEAWAYPWLEANLPPDAVARIRRALESPGGP